MRPTDTRTSACSTIATKKINVAHQRQVGNSWRRVLTRRQARHLQRQRRRQRRHLPARSRYRKVDGAADSKGVNEPVGGHSAFTQTASACSTTTMARLLPAISGSITWPPASRSRSRIRWSRACARRTWLSRTWCTIPAATASGRSLRFSTCRSTWRATGRMRPSSTFTAGRLRRA